MEGGVEIHYTWYLYFHNDLEFLQQILKLWSKFIWKHFGIPIFVIWNICTCANCEYSLMKCILVSKLHTLLLLNPLHTFQVSCCIPKKFPEKVTDYIHDFIYEPHLSKGNLSMKVSNRYHVRKLFKEISSTSISCIISP